MNTKYNKVISDMLLDSQKKLSEQLRLTLANSIDLSPIVEAQKEMFQELSDNLNKVIQDMFSGIVENNNVFIETNNKLNNIKNALLSDFRKNLFSMPYELNIPDFTKEELVVGIKHLLREYDIEYIIGRPYDGNHGDITIKFFRA